MPNKIVNLLREFRRREETGVRQTAQPGATAASRLRVIERDDAARGMKLKRIHSLQALLPDLKEDGAETLPMVERVRDLDSYGVDARYPSQEKSSEEFRPEEAVKKAGIALEWAKKEVARAQSGVAIR